MTFPGIYIVIYRFYVYLGTSCICSILSTLHWFYFICRIFHSTNMPSVIYSSKRGHCGLNFRALFTCMLGVITVTFCAYERSFCFLDFTFTSTCIYVKFTWFRHHSKKLPVLAFLCTYIATLLYYLSYSNLL